MGARNDTSDDTPIMDPAVQKAVQEDWQNQGRTWEVNPPLASHFGGVWERAIGQVRQILQAYLLPKEDRILYYDEFHTLLLSAAKIVNSTPLWESPTAPDEPQPITPQHLLTQRDDGCNEIQPRPVIYSDRDLAAYGANRWRRIRALAAEFERYWREYIYSIGTQRETWVNT